MRIASVRKTLTKLDLDMMYLTSPENVRYFSGFSGDNGHLLISQNDLILLTDGRFTEQAALEAPAFTVKLMQGGLRALADFTNGLRVGFESDHLTYHTALELQSACGNAAWFPLSDFGVDTRMVKDQDEIACITRACEMADTAFSALLPQIKPGITEQDLRAILEYELLKVGSDGVAFPTIVACGAHSSLPHAVPSDRVVAENDLITFDFGAVYRGYRSDITRTVCLGSPKLHSLWETVITVQEKLVDAVRPGVSCQSLDTYQRELFSEQNLSHLIAHSLGHGVGLHIHEDPRVSQNSKTVLSPGMVITIEPGLYLPGEGGVRTEDTVLVTENGCTRLTRTPHYITR